MLVREGGGRSMALGSALELIQSFNNHKIIDASDSILKECQLNRNWEFFRITIYLIQLPELLIEMQHKLLSVIILHYINTVVTIR